MNKQVKIEIWNDNTIKDDLVGTCFIEISNDDTKNSFGPKYINIYGPPLEPKDKDQYDHMCMRGEHGSCYRGRLLCSFEIKREKA
jgi:hypothetical protein